MNSKMYHLVRGVGGLAGITGIALRIAEDVRDISLQLDLLPLDIDASKVIASRKHYQSDVHPA